MYMKNILDNSTLQCFFDKEGENNLNDTNVYNHREPNDSIKILI